MSIIAVLSFIFFLIYLLIYFGWRIHARNATSWWIVMLFLSVGVVHPDSYQYLADFLGIKLISNFVLGAMILFLVKTTLENSAENTKSQRKLREFTATEAAHRFCSTKTITSGVPGKMKILVAFPTFNEMGNIENIFSNYNSNVQKFSDHEYLFCFVNDASTDNTEQELRIYWPNNFVSHFVNGGVAGVLMTGFKIGDRLGLDYVVQCDSDGQHPIECIPELVATAIATQADITIGSRFFDKTADHDSLESTSPIRRMGGIFISLVLRCFFPLGRISDPTSGFRVYSKKATKVLLKNMPDDYPEPESLAICSSQGMKIVEVPVRMRERQQGLSSISGMKSIEFMVKVCTSLLAMRVRKMLFISR